MGMLRFDFLSSFKMGLVQHRIWAVVIGLLALCVMSDAAMAQAASNAASVASTGPMQSIPLFTATPAAGGTTNYSVPVQTLLLFTALSFLPAALLLLTSFTRIIIVFSLLRQALGLQGVPPNQVLVGMSLILTFFIMRPALEESYQTGWIPYSEKKVDFEQAIVRGAEPFRRFMLRNTREDDLSVFSRLSKTPVESRDAIPFSVLVPAFVTSELKTAFMIGFVIYLPFIIIDFAVAAVLTALGMVMVSPMMFALPLKLVVFVLADGWTMLATSLVASFEVR
jgi:flagellar biosynthetic protein FliP